MHHTHTCDVECFGYGNPLAFIPQIFIPFFHPFQMRLHEFFMISFLSVFFHWNFVFTTIGIENHMQWQKANFSIKIYIIRCIDAFNCGGGKGNCLINRNISNSHAGILCSPDLWMQPMNKAMTMYIKQVIERMQQRNLDIDILPLPDLPFSNSPLWSLLCDVKCGSIVAIVLSLICTAKIFGI